MQVCYPFHSNELTPIFFFTFADHEIRIIAEIAGKDEAKALGINVDGALNIRLMTDSIWLDAAERKRTAQASHEM